MRGRLNQFEKAPHNQMEAFERETLWKYDSEFDNSRLLNSLSMTTLYQPLICYT